MDADIRRTGGAMDDPDWNPRSAAVNLPPREPRPATTTRGWRRWRWADVIAGAIGILLLLTITGVLPIAVYLIWGRDDPAAPAAASPATRPAAGSAEGFPFGFDVRITFSPDGSRAYISSEEGVWKLDDARAERVTEPDR